MNAGEAQIPWSAPQILFYLESKPEYRVDLLALASCLPDVASRTLLCPFFSYRPLNQFALSPIFSMLSSMCNHAMTQQKQYELGVANDESDGHKGDGGGVADEVTFAATLTRTLLEGSMVALGSTLLPLICNTQERLLTVLWRRLHTPGQIFFGDEFHGIRPIKTQRSITLVSQRKALKRAREKLTLSLRHLVPVCLASTTKVVCTLSFFERTELLSRLGNISVPFQVRSRDEVKQQLNAQKALNTSMTVVVPGQILPPPWWRRQTRHSEAMAETKSIDKSSAVTSSRMTPPPPPPKSPPPLVHNPHEEYLPNATWVKEGELALVNGRIVHREVKESVRGEGKKGKVAWASRIEQNKETTGVLELPLNEGKKRENRKKMREKPSFREERDVFLSTTKPDAVGTQHLPLISKDEILALVNDLQISDVLRAAFLIGLNNESSKDTSKDNM